MCAYNAVDGQPACVNTMLLQQKLRQDWGFNGYVTSDCGAIGDISGGHKYAANETEASVDAVKAGTDTSCGNEYATLVDAVKKGMISEKEIDQSVIRLFTARYRLGMLGDAPDDPYAGIPISANDTEEHRTLAHKAADESMVLLKNNGVLPLDTGRVKTIAVVGPNAESLAALEGNYNGEPSRPSTPIDAIRERFGNQAKVLYAQGAGYAEGVDTPVPSSVFSTGTGSDARPGLDAEYVVGDGAPVHRVDPHIDFDWNAANPLGGPGIAKAFRVTWSGEFTPPAPGEYVLKPAVNGCYPCGDTESYRMYLDGQLVIQGEAAGEKGRKGPGYRVTFADTKPHAFKLEYTHNSPVFAAGISLMWQPPAAALQEKALAAAKQADVVLAFMGLSPNLEGEEMPIHVPGFSGGDRTDIGLPAPQEQLLEALGATGKPLVVVLLNGSALAVDWAQQHASAILEAWYPGEEGGRAIADTLAGDNDPGGRLPVTFYTGLNELPPFEDYSMANRTYRYFKGKPLYGFGFGLSYASFRFRDLHVSSPTVKAGAPVTVDAEVENTSSRAGDTVAELYLGGPEMPGAPIRWLAGFERVRVQPHATEHVTFQVDPRAMSLVDAQGKRAVRPGAYTLFVGGAQPAEDPSGVKGSFTVEGSHDLPE
jgi:beta-glucosidase